MSEQISENPPQQPQGTTDTPQSEASSTPAPPQQPPASSGDVNIPLRFVKRETGRTHTVVTNGVQQTVPIVHGETGEPESEYVLLASIDGVDVTLATYNAGRIESAAASAKAQQANQQAV